MYCINGMSLEYVYVLERQGSASDQNFMTHRNVMIYSLDVYGMFIKC